MFDYGFQQNIVQKQVQALSLSQKQLLSLEVLYMSKEDLRASVYAEVEKNPALIITKDIGGEIAQTKKHSGPKDSTRLSSSYNASRLQASDNFQAALEAHPDHRESLKTHLLSQLHMLDLSTVEQDLGERLIHNLDNKGFHILSPASLLDPSKGDTYGHLTKLTSLIQHFDPIGTCTKDVEESLWVQCSMMKNAPDLAKMILDHNINFLNPPSIEKVTAKIIKYQKDLGHMIGLSETHELYKNLSVTPQSVKEAIDFIRTLDPYPARNFDTDEIHYISPDIYVERTDEVIERDDFKNGLVKKGQFTWKVRLAKNMIPEVAINPDYQEFKAKENSSRDEKKLIKDGIKQAENFIEALESRQNTLLEACCYIVKLQNDFFQNGPGHLNPLRQVDLANKLGLHDATISRMANTKYIQCEWGLFDIKYFFSNAVNPSTWNDQSKLVSKDQVLTAIKQILEENKDSQKKLSDQKISDILASKNIMVARRTVAKYRSQLNIESSFDR